MSAEVLLTPFEFDGVNCFPCAAHQRFIAFNPIARLEPFDLPARQINRESSPGVNKGWQRGDYAMLTMAASLRGCAFAFCNDNCDAAMRTSPRHRRFFRRLCARHSS